MPTRPRVPRAVDYRVDPFDLLLYLSVLQYGTITGAAQSVGLSLAAASERLAALEHTVGTPLLARSKKGARATDAGLALGRHAHRVLAELDALHIDMAAYAHGLHGTVRLFGNTAAMSHALPARLGSFLTDHPDIDLDLRDLPSDAVLDALRRGACDVGVMADHVDTSGLVARPWMKDQLVCIASRRHALPKGRTVRFGYLLAEPWVGLPADSGLSRFLLQQAARAGRLPRHRVRVNGLDAVAAVVADGVGVAVVPAFAAQRYANDRMRTVALADVWATRQLLVCWRPEPSPSTGVQRLVDHLLQA